MKLFFLNLFHILGRLFLDFGRINFILLLRKLYCLFANTALLFLLCFVPKMLDVSRELHVMSYGALV